MILLLFSWWWCDWSRRRDGRRDLTGRTEGRSEWASPRIMTLLCYHVKWRNESWRWQWQERSETQIQGREWNDDRQNQMMPEIRFWEMMQCRWDNDLSSECAVSPEPLSLLTWATWGHMILWSWQFLLNLFSVILLLLVDVSDIFLFFPVLGRGKGGGVRGGGQGGRFKYRGRGGGFPRRRRGRGKGAGGISVGRGGGLNIFFRGRNAHQVLGWPKETLNHWNSQQVATWIQSEFGEKIHL